MAYKEYRSDHGYIEVVQKALNILQQINDYTKRKNIAKFLGVSTTSVFKWTTGARTPKNKTDASEVVKNLKVFRNGIDELLEKLSDEME